MSIREEIFSHNKTLYDVLDYEGVPINNQRIEGIETQINTVVSDLNLVKTDLADTQYQLTQVSVKLYSLDADFNAQKIIVQNELDSLTRRLELVDIAITAMSADLVSTNIEVRALRTHVDNLVSQIAVMQSNLDAMNVEITSFRTNLNNLIASVRAVEVALSEVALQSANNERNINLLTARVAILEGEIKNSPSLFVLQNRRTNLYVRDGTTTFTYFIDWDTPAKADYLILANIGYYAMIRDSRGGTFRTQVTLVASFDTIRKSTVVNYPILQGNINFSFTSGQNGTGYALVDN